MQKRSRKFGTGNEVIGETPCQVAQIESLGQSTHL